MNEKLKFFIIKLQKILSIIFFVSAIGSFVAALIFNIKNEAENILFFVFANLGVTLFYRLVLAVFFFAFAMFMDEWLKVDDKE